MKINDASKEYFCCKLTIFFYHSVCISINLLKYIIAVYHFKENCLLNKPQNLRN